METQQIIESLSYITWLLLGSLATGSLALLWLLRQLTDATSGFLGFSALVSAFIGLGWLLVELGLPAPTDLAIEAGSDLTEPRRGAVALFVVAAFVAGVRLSRGSRALWTGALAIVAGLAAMALGAAAWTGGSSLAASVFVQFVAIAAVTGGSLAAVILAHWYLVTPKISSLPLILTTRLLTWALGIQILLYWTWLATGIPASEPFAALTGSNAVFVWLRLVVGLVFPLVLVWMAYRTALTRSMESATGLLYIEFAVVMASTIVAAGLYFGEGVLV